MEVTEFVEKYAVERQNTASLKWDLLEQRFGDADLLPIWVADMEFKTPEAIREALIERVNHGVFGYSFAPDSYYQAFIDWQQRRHGVRVEKDWIRFAPGVVSAIYWIVQAFTAPGDGILIQTPVYYPFHNAVKDTGRKLVKSALTPVGDTYQMDLADFESKILAENVKLFILCNPANPAGRVWHEDELAAVLAICEKHNVLVIADEIHQDIILPGNRFVSSLSVADEKYHKNLIVATAGSKTFNLASLLNSNIVIPDADLRAEYDRKIKQFNQVEISVLGQVALEAGYRKGEAWLDDLIAVIAHNYELVKKQLAGTKVEVKRLEGTYLLFLDFGKILKPAEIKPFIQDKCRLAVDFGAWFGAESECCVRLNLATTPANVQTAIDAILRELKKI